MEYGIETFVLILLVVGTIFLLIGLVLNLKSTDPENRRLSSVSSKPTEEKDSQRKTNSDPMSVYHPNIPEGSIHTRPGGQEAPSEILRPVMVRHRDNLEVDVYSKNIEFFKKQVYLYFDHEKNNIYTGSGQKASLENNEISSIKRVGLGTLSYNGSNFSFHHQSRDYSFNIIDLDHIALYPNCLVLVSQKDVPTALLFMDETDTIRKLLDVFKAK